MLLYLSVKNTSTKIPFELTYGLHRDLQEYLLSEDRLFKLFTDIEVSNTVLQMCLSKRNTKGQVIETFDDLDLLDVEEITMLLDELYDYFQNFFLKHQEMVQQTLLRLNQISNQ